MTERCVAAVFLKTESGDVYSFIKASAVESAIVSVAEQSMGDEFAYVSEYEVVAIGLCESSIEDLLRESIESKYREVMRGQGY